MKNGSCTIWSSTFCTMVRPWWSAKTLSETKIVLKEDYGDYLVVVNRDNPLQLSKFGRNYHGREALSRNWQNASGTDTFALGVGQQKSSNCSTQCSITRRTTDAALINWAMKLYETVSPIIFAGLLTNWLSLL